MQRDRVDEILRNKLHDLPVSGSTPSWKEMQRRMILADRANPKPRIQRLNSWVKYSAAAIIMLVMGLSINNLSQKSREIAHIQPQYPLVALQADAPSDRDVSVLDQTARKKTNLADLLSAARSISVVSNGTKSSLTSLPNSTSLSKEIAAALSGVEFDNDLSEVTEHRNNATSYLNDPTTTTRVGRAASSSVSHASTANSDALEEKFTGFDWGNKPAVIKKSWIASAYSGTFASSQNESSRRTLNSMNSFNAAIVEMDFITKTQSYVGRELNHKFPVSFGLTIRKNINPRLGIETGLVYTFMESTAKMDGAFNKYKYSQKLHYLGIPINLSYSLYRNNNFNLYAMGGVMAEKALSAKGTTNIFDGDRFMSGVTTNLTATGLLWSVNAAIGVEYDFIKDWGIYVEPGFSYYFPNSSQPSSYRTYNPANFNLRAGFRFKF